MILEKRLNAAIASTFFDSFSLLHVFRKSFNGIGEGRRVVPFGGASGSSVLMSSPLQRQGCHPSPIQ